MIQDELRHIIAQVDDILRNPEDSVAELRWHSAVLAYGRCFVSADGRGTKLESTHVQELGKNQTTLHNKIMELRNQYIAHSGKNEQQRVVVALPITGAKADLRIEQVVYQKVTEISPGHQHFQKFRQLAMELATAVDKLLVKAEDALLAEYRTFPPKSLLSAAGIAVTSSGESAP